ncbi:MAG: hypothetical protein U0174_14055 [Polyangiaceae bacterium]
MSAAHRRAADLERDAAKVLGGERVRYRARYESAPDIRPIRLQDGRTLQAEAKTRKRLPAIVLEALAQAERYARGAIPVGVIRQRGGKALAVLWLPHLASLLGIEPPEPPERKTTKREQLGLFAKENDDV